MNQRTFRDEFRDHLAARFPGNSRIAWKAMSPRNTTPSSLPLQRWDVLPCFLPPPLTYKRAHMRPLSPLAHTPTRAWQPRPSGAKPLSFHRVHTRRCTSTRAHTHTLTRTSARRPPARCTTRALPRWAPPPGPPPSRLQAWCWRRSGWNFLDSSRQRPHPPGSGPWAWPPHLQPSRPRCPPPPRPAPLTSTPHAPQQRC